MRAHDIFLSHASDDAASARDLRAVLEGAGYTCWMAPDDVTSTSSWAEQILDAIDECRGMIVLISASANASEHVSREVNLARARNRPVLPIRIEPVGAGGALEYFLSLVQRIDAFPPPITNHAATILGRVERMLPAEKPKRRTTRKKPDGEASFPERTVPKPTPGPDGRFAPGTRIGAFTIESVLGEGGMATVYRARQDEPNRAVALKVIRADRAADATYRSRFLTEKDTLAQLEHPSIVPIYAAGEAGGVLYIAMRLVDGPDLGARLKTDGPMSVRETAVFLRPIADAVDHAHESGVLHRDLKPSNILIDRAGRPYLTDFGLGKVVGTDLGLSTPGTVIGTLAYVAPEQLTGGGDPAQAVRADIYALGCVAFACLTGRPPFDASNLDQTVYAITQGPRPRATAIRPELPSAVDAVLDRALSRDPSERPEDAGALIADLVNVADAEDGRTTPIPRPTRRPLLDRLVRLAPANPTATAIAAALAVILVGGVAFAALGGFPPGPSPTPAPTATPSPTPTPTPTATPMSTAFPTAVETELIDLLPSVASPASCERYDDKYESALAMVRCNPPSGPAESKVFYALYENSTDLKEQYDSIMAAANVAEGGKCVEAIPANAPYGYGEGDSDDGYLACYAREESVQYVWTHKRLRVLAAWLAPDNTTGYNFWTEWATAVGE